MPATDIVLGLLAADEIPSRTMLQKLVYFVAEESGQTLDYSPYFYGPYSAELQEDLESLVAAGLVEEQVSTFEPWQPGPFDGVRYRYRLTREGQDASRAIPDDVRETCERVVRAAKDAGAWNQSALSLAAKLHHLRKVDSAVQDEDVPELARQLGWRIESASVGYAARLLALLTG